MLKYILLGYLNYMPLTGYQLKQSFENSARHFWHAQTSQIYRTLGELEAASLLTSTIEEQESRPDRRVYQITEAGRDALRAWLAEPLTEISASKDDLLVKLYFSAQLDKEAVLTQLRLQRALHQKVLRTYQTESAEMIRDSARQFPALRRDALMWELTRRNGELLEAAYLQWLDEAIASIDSDFSEGTF